MYGVAVDGARSRVIVAITDFIPEAGAFTEAIRRSVRALGRDAGRLATARDGMVVLAE